MCDTMIANSSITKRGRQIFGKNSDRSPNEPQPLIFVPAADHPAGRRVKATRVEVDQAPHTYATILSKPSWIWGAEIGINEKGVVIGNEAVITRDLSKTDVALLGMDLLRIALERADTARGAVQVIADMMERYGQGGNCSFDGEFYYENAYLIADGKEIWNVETAGKHLWVARKIEAPSYSISNYLCINSPDMMHRDVLSHAREMGYPVGEPFDWSKAYANWDSLAHSGMLRRACSLQQMQRSGKGFDLPDMLAALRAHFCNDEWTEGMHAVCMHSRNQSYPTDVDCQTTNSLIAVLEPGDALLLSPGMSTPCVAPFQPFWFDAFSAKQVFGYREQEAGVKEWLRREGINRAIVDGRLPVDEYRAEMHEMERRWIDGAQTVAKSDRQAFVDTNARQADAFLKKWLALAAETPSRPMGDQGFQRWWALKNDALGKDSRIAY